MPFVQETLRIHTKGRGFVDVTRAVAEVVARAGLHVGLCHVFIRHTSASLVIQENADPAVLRDLDRWLAKVAPESDDYEHDAEGPDDMPAHLRAAVTKTSETIPVVTGSLGLGTWQALYVFEHRRRPHTRELVVTVSGEGAAR
jgi:secondary thiamine-phosphate synthase enzyme